MTSSPTAGEAPRCQVCREDLRHGPWGWVHAWSGAVVCVQRPTFNCYVNADGHIAYATHPDLPAIRYSPKPRRPPRDL